MKLTLDLARANLVLHTNVDDEFTARMWVDLVVGCLPANATVVDSGLVWGDNRGYNWNVTLTVTNANDLLALVATPEFNELVCAPEGWALI